MHAYYFLNTKQTYQMMNRKQFGHTHKTRQYPGFQPFPSYLSPSSHFQNLHLITERKE